MKYPQPNPGKQLSIMVGGAEYHRYPIPTHKITHTDNIVSVVKDYAMKYLKPSDIIVISERVIAITQGRMIPLSKIHPGFFAKLLCRFVSRHPGGIGLASPWTMELAIQEVGVVKILFAAAVALLTRPMGIRGLFYHIAGGNINAIDGPTDYSLPPGDKSVTLGPKNPENVVQKLSRQLKVSCAIIDANDYGVRVIACTSGCDKHLIEQVLQDNPLGQAREQTPLAVVRKMQ